MKYNIVQQWDITKTITIEAESPGQAVEKLREDEDNNGEVIDCYEVEE